MRRVIEKVDLETGVKVLESYFDLSLPSASLHSSLKSTSTTPSSSSKKRTHVPSSVVHPTLCSQLKRTRRIENFTSLDFDTTLSLSSVTTTASTHHFFSSSSPSSSSSTASSSVEVDVGLSLDQLSEDLHFLPPTRCNPYHSSDNVRPIPSVPKVEEGLLIQNLMKLQLATMTTEESDGTDEDLAVEQQLWMQ